MWGTFAYFAYDGTRDYLSDYGLHREEGSDFKTQSGFDWSWITTQINNGNALYIEKTLKDYDGRSGNHCFLGIGYEITSNGDYIRVCDEWDHSISHFIKYEWSNVDYIWYLRG